MAPNANGDGWSGALAKGHIKTEPGTSSNLAKQPRARIAKKRGYFAVLIALVIRLAVWYSIGTFLFRCPEDASKLTESSPAICKPYLRVRQVTSPYTQPYYDSFVAPHVARAKPYFDQVNDRYISPASEVAQKNYAKYGAPQVDRARAYGQKQWVDTVVPQLSAARQQASKQYQATLGPHVQKVDDAVRPYYSGLTTSANDFWELEIRPAYKFVTPYAQKGYSAVEKVANDVVVPYSQQAAGVLSSTVNRHILPTLQILYGENVEPQIVRIKQRLGRYRDEKKVEAAAASAVVETSNLKSTISSVSSSIASVIKGTTSTASSAATPSPSVVKGENAADQFSKDLALFEQQVTRAVTEGVEHLKERVTEVSDEQHDSQIERVGKSLIVQLEELEAAGVKQIQKAIQKQVSKLPEGPTEADVATATATIDKDIRKVGQDVRNKAQQVRDWRKSLDSETVSLIQAAADSTLETIDNIRDLRLQEIGRRWASHDGVTHRDWAAYNRLKKTSGKWRESVAEAASKHSALEKLRSAAAEVEERAMAVAEDAAKELSRLKSVALWKLRAQDDTDNFENKIVPPVVAKVAEHVSQAVMSASEAVIGTTQGTVESVTSVASEKASEVAESAASIIDAATKPAADAISDASETVASAISGVLPSSLASSILSASSVASELQDSAQSSVSSAASAASSHAGDFFDTAGDSVSSQASIISKTASSLSSVVSERIIGSSDASDEVKGSASTASSSLSSLSSSVSSAASSVSPLSSVSSAVEQASSSASSLLSEASDYVDEALPDASDISSSVGHATSRVWGGAMAQAVPNRQIVLDEDDDETFIGAAIHSAKAEIGSLSKAVDEAIRGKPTSDSPYASATSIASDLYQSAIIAASKALYGEEPTGTAKVAKVASEKYQEAVQAASQVIYGTPKPFYQDAAEGVRSRVEAYTSSAEESWKSAIAFAQSQSDIAKSQVSAQISGKPKPIHEEMLESVSKAYWDALKGAKSKYDSALAQTTSIEDAARPPYESVSRAASLQLAAALSAVSEQYSKATSAAGLEPTPAPQAALNEARRRYYEGLGYAHDRYSSYLASATSALRSAGLPVAPTSTPFYELYLSKAQNQYAHASAAAQSALNEALASASSVAGVKETSPAESVLSAASAQYSSAVKAASEYLYKTQTPAYVGMVAAAQSRYDDLASSASSAYQSLASAAVTAAGDKPTITTGYASAVSAASSQYDAALSALHNGLSRASEQARIAVYGTETGIQASASSAFSSLVYGADDSWTEQLADQAKENWEAIVSRASERIYGEPTPVYASITSQAGSLAAQATSAAGAQYSAIAALFSSVVSGREPAYSDKVFAQLSSAYYTGAPAVLSSASSVAADALSSASSAISSVFTPPATINDILSGLTAQIDSAVSAASVNVYGTEKGAVEKATSAAAASASDVTATLAQAAEQAEKAISEALFGPPTPTAVVDKVAAGASGAYDAAASRVSDLFAPQKTSAWEAYQKQIADAVADARKKIESAGFAAGGNAAAAAQAVKESVQSVVDKVRDEL